MRTLSLCAVSVSLAAFGLSNTIAAASEPGIFEKMLTPSPLGKDRVLAVCMLEKHSSEGLEPLYNAIDWKAFNERDLRLVEVSPNAVQSVMPSDGGGLIRARHEDFGGYLRRTADCSNDNLEFVLIGKDTGAKKRWHDTVDMRRVFLAIDAMPMRRYEMRQFEMPEQKQDN